MKRFPRLILQASFAVILLNSCKKENTSAPEKQNNTTLSTSSVNASVSTSSEPVKKKVGAIKYPKKPK